MRNKYLREILPKDEIPSLLHAKFDERDTFNLDYTLIAWLYERLRYFQDEVSKTIDLAFRQFEIDGKNLTQIECIDRMVEDCRFILKENGLWGDNEEEVNAAKDDLFYVLSKVYWSMWW